MCWHSLWRCLHAQGVAAGVYDALCCRFQQCLWPWSTTSGGVSPFEVCLQVQQRKGVCSMHATCQHGVLTVQVRYRAVCGPPWRICCMQVAPHPGWQHPIRDLPARWLLALAAGLEGRAVCFLSLNADSQVYGRCVHAVYRETIFCCLLWLIERNSSHPVSRCCVHHYPCSVDKVTASVPEACTTAFRPQRPQTTQLRT